MRAWIAAAGCALAAAACPAADLPVVQVVGQRAAIATASAGTVGADRIAERGMQRPGDLLAFVPGLAVTQHSGAGKANQYFLRGFSLDHGTDFATFVDGMPVNLRSHAHGQGYTDLNFVIPELVRRIDYSKGPYAAADGDFASAGSARIALVDSVPAGIASVTAGQRGYRRVLMADTLLTDTLPGGLLYALDAQRNDGPWQVPEQARRFSAMLRWQEGGTSLTALAYRNRWNATDQIPQRAVAALGRFGSADPTDGGQASRYSLSFAHEAPLAGGRVAVNAYAVRSTLDLYSDFTYALERPEDGDQFRQSERRTLLGLDAAWTGRATLAGRPVRNTVGVQLRSDRVAPVGLYTTAARRITGTVREDRVHETSVALYGDSAVQWTPWLRTVAGMRAETFRFATGAGSRTAGIALPKLSVLAGPWRDTELFFHAGQGFHSNDARGVADGVTPLVRTRGIEAGIRSEAVPGLVTSLALWRLASGSELVYVGDVGTTVPSPASRRRGVEWSGEYTAGPWRFGLDVSASRARYTQAPDGNRVPGALDKLATASLAYAPAGGPWSGSVDVRWTGPRALTADGAVRSAGTALADARIAYRIDGRTRLMLDVFNVANRRASDAEYWYASRLPREAAARDDVHFHPVEPRTVRLTLTYAF